jgi:hypothetical protein
MITEEITNAEITEYLLGVGDPARSETIEELTFSGDHFAEKVDAVERDLIDAYACGELGPIERSQFESHYLASPLRRERLKIAETFNLFIHRPQARASPEPEPDMAARRFTGWTALFALRPALRFSFAALGLLLAAAGWWLVSNDGREVATDIGQPAPASSAEGPPPSLVYPVEPDRAAGSPSDPTVREGQTPNLREDRAGNSDLAPGTDRPDNISPRRKPGVLTLVLPAPVRGGELRTIPVPASADLVAVALELESAEFVSYRVALIEQGGDRTIWRSGALKPKPANNLPRLNVVVPADLLDPQIYRFTVSGVTDRGTIEIIADYPFRVVQ